MSSSLSQQWYQSLVLTDSCPTSPPPHLAISSTTTTSKTLSHTKPKPVFEFLLTPLQLGDSLYVKLAFKNKLFRQNHLDLAKLSLVTCKHNLSMYTLNKPYFSYSWIKFKDWILSNNQVSTNCNFCPILLVSAQLFFFSVVTLKTI